jgi:hypothetical protein
VPRPLSSRITMKKGRTHLRWVSQLMISGRREWDMQLLHTCMHDHDIDEVSTLCLSHTLEDTLAWHYDRHGLFSVRSAYRLALQIDCEEQRAIGCSSHPDGSQQLYKTIWAAQLPPKVWVFAWRLTHEGLATQSNKRSQNLIEEATCQICGAMEESGYHVVIQCTKARALRKVMRRHWDLPGEESFRYLGPDWLLLLLQKVNKVMGARILLLLWRVWFLRNDIIHGDGKCTVSGSEGFLLSYCESLGVAEVTPTTSVSDKGKHKLGMGRRQEYQEGGAARD